MWRNKTSLFFHLCNKNNYYIIFGQSHKSLLRKIGNSPQEAGISGWNFLLPESLIPPAGPGRLAEGWRGIKWELLAFAWNNPLNVLENTLVWSNQSDLAVVTFSTIEMEQIWLFFPSRVSPVECEPGVGRGGNQFLRFFSSYPTSSVSPTENHQFARR